MDKNRRHIALFTNEQISETSSKGNQEKWFDKKNGYWYKLDQFGYEALCETLISRLLQLSNIEKETPFTFVRYSPARVNVHGRDRTCCTSKSFLNPETSIITLSQLYNKTLNVSITSKLSTLSSIKKRIAYLADYTRDVTGLENFPEYLCLLFEIDSLFLNDDRHLNNIAVIEKNNKFSYCPIFDNGAALLSNMQCYPIDIEPKALISTARARPLCTTFARQMNTIRSLYKGQLKMPKLQRSEIISELNHILEFYPPHNRGIISDRVLKCIAFGQKKLQN